MVRLVMVLAVPGERTDRRERGRVVFRSRHSRLAESHWHTVSSSGGSRQGDVVLSVVLSVEAASNNNTGEADISHWDTDMAL